MAKDLTKNKAMADALAAAAAHAGAGLETVTADDLTIPRLVVAQKLSPQLDRASPDYIEGAKEGDLCETAMGIAHEEVEFVPVNYLRNWLQWSGPRGAGKLVAVHPTGAILEQCGADWPPTLPNGDRIVETAQFAGLLIEAAREPMEMRCLVTLHGTQLKRARKWLAMAMSEKIAGAEGKPVTAPLWWRSYKLSSVQERNDQGSWAALVVERGRTLPELCIAYQWQATGFMERCTEFQRLMSETHSRLAGPVAQAADDLPF